MLKKQSAVTPEGQPSASVFLPEALPTVVVPAGAAAGTKGYDQHNLEHLRTPAAVDPVHAIDAVNAGFYGKITYPYPPQYFERLSFPHFWAGMLDQDLGCWQDPVLPADNATILVAGCGTNQALMTALKFPEARVIGADLSEASLAVCSRNASQLGVTNLELRQESINQFAYRNQFDYVICTGVIHHNADPAATLARLAAALKRNGVLELMVYNWYHRILNTSFAKAVRILAGSAQDYDYDLELELSRKIMAGFQFDNDMKKFLGKYHQAPLAEFADDVIQPLEYGYTVESMNQLATGCGLTTLQPVVDQFSKSRRTVNWNFNFNNAELQERYHALPDLARWQTANLLLENASPLLWFYFQRQDSGRERVSEKAICQRLLDSTCRRTRADRQIYRRTASGDYAADERIYTFPGTPGDELGRKVYEGLDEGAPLREAFRKAGVSTDFYTVNQVRLHLLTSGFPYLRVLPAGGPEHTLK